MRKHHLIKLNKFVCCLVILSLFFQFVPSREPAQAADKSIFERAGDWLAKLTTKIALPDITLDEKGDLMVGTFNLVNCIGSDTEVIDGHKICKDPVNPFSQFKLSMNGKEVKSQIALVEPTIIPGCGTMTPEIWDKCLNEVVPVVTPDATLEKVEPAYITKKITGCVATPCLEPAATCDTSNYVAYAKKKSAGCYDWYMGSDNYSNEKESDISKDNVSWRLYWEQGLGTTFGTFENIKKAYEYYGSPVLQEAIKNLSGKPLVQALTDTNPKYKNLNDYVSTITADKFSDPTNPDGMNFGAKSGMEKRHNYYLSVMSAMIPSLGGLADLDNTKLNWWGPDGPDSTGRQSARRAIKTALDSLEAGITQDLTIFGLTVEQIKEISKCEDKLLQAAQASPECINPKKGELTMPEPSLPEICDLSIPLPGDNGCSGVGDKCESKILAKNKACIALNRLQESAAQEVYSAYKIFNATDPFTDCLFVRNCRTNCSLRIGEIAFTVSLLDVAALFVPGGFLNVIQKILNIAKMINQAFKIFTAIKEALSSGVTFLNDLFKVMGNLSAMYASFTNLGLNWSDMLIYGAGSFASQYGGNKLKEIGLDRGGNIGLLEDKAGGLATAGNGLLGGVAAVTALNIDKVGKAVNGMQDMLGNFAQNNLKFAAAKTAALKANDKLKANVDDIRSRFKAEPEFSFFFKTGGAQDTAETSINKQKLDNILSDFQLFFRSVDAFLSDVKQAASLKDGRPISDLVPGGGLAEWQDRFDPPNQLLGLKYVCDEDEGVELPLGGFLPVIPGGIYQCYVPNMVTPVSSGWVDSFQKYVDNTFYLKDYFALTDPEVVKKAIIGCDDLSCFNPGGCPDGPVATDCISCYGTTDPDGCSVNYNNKTWREYWDKLGRTIGSFNNVKAIYNNCKEYVRPDINRHNLECAAELKNIIVELVGPNLSGHFYTVDEALNFSEKDAKYKNLFELYQAEADDMREKQEKLQYMLGVMYPLLYQFKNTDPVVGVVKTYNGIARLDEKVNGQGWKDTRGGINDALFALKAGQMNTTYMNSYPAFRLNITNQFSEDLVARTDGLDEPALGSKFWNDYWFSDSELTIYPNNSYVERRIISDKPYEGEAAYEDWDEKVKIIGANQSNFKNVKEALSLGVSPEEPIVVYKIAKANKVLDNIKSLAGNVDNPDWNVMAGQIIDSIIYGIPKSDPACLGFGCNEATQNLNLGRFRACCENGIYQTQIYPNEKDFRNYSNCCVDEDKVDAQGNSIPSQSCCALGNKCNEGEISDKVFYDKYVPLCNTCINGTCACLSCGGGGVNPPPVAECGNGVIEGTEQCDDHNTNNGDGCSADCKNEVAPPSQCYSCFLGACRAIAGIGYLDPFCYDTCNTSPLPSGTACASNPNNASQWCACQKTPDQFYINNGVKIALPICYNTPTNCTYDNSNCSVVIAPPHDFDCTSPTIQYYDCVAGTCAEVNYTTPYTDDTCGGIVCEVPILPPGSVCASNPNNASQWCACQKTPDQFYTNNGVKIALPSCYPNCIYSNSNCIATPPVAVCSNGIAEGNEKCDGSDLNGKDCMDFGYVKGDLTCNNDCTFNKDDCSSESGPVCNNGIIEIGEQCDLSNFNGKTCQTYGFTGGTLSCLNSCTRIGTVNCGNFYQCLNGLCVPGGNRNNNDPNCGGGCGTTYYTCDSENIGHCKISNFGATDYTTQASCEANNRCGVPNPVIYKCLDLIDWLGSGAIEHYCVCREGEDLRTCGIRVSNVPIDERECYTSSGACPYPLGFLSNNQKFVKVNIFDSIKQKVGIFVKNLIKIPEVFARTVFGECNKLGTRKYECVVDGEVLYTCDDCTNKNCLNGSHPGYPNGCEKEVADPLANEDKYCYPDSNCNSNVCEDTQADCKFYCLDDYCNGYNDPCTLRDYYEQTYQCYDTHEKLFSDGYSKYDSGTTTVKFFNDNRGTLAEAITLTAQNLQDATLALSVAFEKLQRDWNATPEPFSSENQESAMVSSTIHKILQLQENSEKIINDIIPNRVIPTLNIIKTNRDFIQSIISAAPGSVNVDVLKNIVQGFNDAIDALQNSADEDGDGFPDGVIDFAYAKIGPKDLGTNYRCGIGKCSSSRTTFLCSLKCFEEDNQRTFKQLTTYTEILRNVENAAYGLTQAGENIKAIEPSMDMKPVTIKPNLVNELDERAQCCKSDCKTTDNANENKCEYISYSVINKNGDTQKNPVVQCSWTTAKCKEKTSLYVGQQTGTSNYEFFKTNLLANPLSTLEDRFKAVSASVDLLMDENVGIVAAFGDSTKNLDGLIKNNNVYGRDSNKRKEYTKLSEAVLKQARYMWWDLIWGNAGVSQELLPACSATEQILTNDPSDIQNQCATRLKNSDNISLLPPDAKGGNTTDGYIKLKNQCSALANMDLDVLDNLQAPGGQNYIDRRIAELDKMREGIGINKIACPEWFCLNPKTLTRGAGMASIDQHCIENCGANEKSGTWCDTTEGIIWDTSKVVGPVTNDNQVWPEVCNLAGLGNTCNRGQLNTQCSAMMQVDMKEFDKVPPCVKDARIIEMETLKQEMSHIAFENCDRHKSGVDTRTYNYKTVPYIACPVNLSQGSVISSSCLKPNETSVTYADIDTNGTTNYFNSYQTANSTKIKAECLTKKTRLEELQQSLVGSGSVASCPSDNWPCKDKASCENLQKACGQLQDGSALKGTTASGDWVWPPDNEPNYIAVQNNCISTQQEAVNLDAFSKILTEIGGPSNIDKLTNECNNLNYQTDLARDCYNFSVLQKALGNETVIDENWKKWNNGEKDYTTRPSIWIDGKLKAGTGIHTDMDQDVENIKKDIDGFCRSKNDTKGKIITETINSEINDISGFFKCSGDTIGIDLTGLSCENSDCITKAQQAREVALKLCSQSTTDMRTPLNEVMKVFSVLLGVKSGTVSVNGLSALYFDAQKIRQRAQDVINLIKEAPKKFEELWNSKDEVQKLSKDNVDIKYVKCIAGPMISYAGNGQALTGANGGQVCPNVGEQFSQLDASFSDIRQNLRMIDMARIQPTKAIGFGNLSLDIPKIELIDQDLNEVVGPIYEKAQEIKNKSQLLWALATAINYANENCTCGQSYCPQLGPVPLCISGLPLTIAPLTQPFCHLIWTLRYSLGSLAEKLKQELEKQ